MDAYAGLNGVMATLAQLRANAVLAVNTSGERAVSWSDVERFDALVVGAFGPLVATSEFVLLGSSPNPDGIVMAALLERMPREQAEEAYRFLVDLYERVHHWLTS